MSVLLAVDIFGKEEIDWLYLTLFMAGIVAFTVLFETGVHKLEHVAHESMQRLVSKVFKELAVLGVISFTTLITLQVMHPTDENLSTFEFAQ